MKIIAQTSGGFLMEATVHEIKNVMGHYAYADEKDTGKIAVGQEIPISESYEQLAALQAIRKKLTEASATLRAAAASIDAVKTPAVTIEKKSAR